MSNTLRSEEAGLLFKLHQKQDLGVHKGCQLASKY